MITTEIPKGNLKLFELVKRYNAGLDIGDTVFDWGTYFECPQSWQECNDYYDRLMLLIGLNVECEKFNMNWYSPCNITGFIKENIKAFKKFFNEENREGFRPCDYEEADDPTKDAGFYEAYLQGMGSLLIGNYSEDDYKKLYELLIQEE